MQKKHGYQTIFWWVAWILLTIGSFFAAAGFWTPVIAKRFGSIHETKTAVIWVSAVFGTWMVFLLPLIIVMYQKVDKAYEDARIRREEAAARFRSILVERSKRLLSPELKEKLKNWPETIRGGHLLTVILKNGRRIPHVFVAGGEEVLGIYDFTQLPFEGPDIADIEPADMSCLPAFFTANWLRLDGVAAVIADGGGAVIADGVATMPE